MVFLSVAGDNGIAAGCIAIHLVLAYHRGGSVLGYHESRIQAGIGNQKLRQPAQSHNELGNATLGNISQLGKGDTQEIVRNGKRLPVEVSAGDNEVFVRKIVGLSVTELISVSKTEDT